MGDSFPFVNAPTIYLTTQLNYIGGISAFQVVGYNGSNQVTLVTANSYASFPPVGISLSVVSNGTFYPFVSSGIVTNPGWTFSPGKVVLDNSGNVTQTFGGLGLISILGYAVGVHSIYFDPQGFPLVRVTA